MPWPFWPSHQSLLTALAQRSAQFPQCWVLITHARSDKCPQQHVAALSQRTSLGRPAETDRLGVWMLVREPLPSNPYLSPSLLSGLISFSLMRLTFSSFLVPQLHSCLLIAQVLQFLSHIQYRLRRNEKSKEIRIENEVQKKMSSVISLYTISGWTLG